MMAQIPTASTVLLLQSLKPGEEMVYYKGDLEGDIIRCNPGRYGTDSGAPNYQIILVSIQETVRDLVRQGRIITRCEERVLGMGKYRIHIAVCQK